MAGTLAPQLEILDGCPVEEHHCLGTERAVLRRPERQHVDTRAPGHIGRVTAQERDGVREPRAVHVDLQSPLVRDGAQRGELGGTIRRAKLSRLSYRHRGGLHAVQRNRMRGENGFERSGRELAVRAGDQHELRSAGEESRRTALIACDVRLLVGVDGSIRRAQRSQAQRVRSRAGGNREGAHWRVEERAQHLVQALSPLIVSVGFLQAMVHRRDRVDDLRTGAGGVVTEKSHGPDS